MSYNYAPLATKTVALIAKFGKQVTLEADAATGTPSDAAKPWRGTTATPTTATPKGVVSSFSKNEINGDLIRSTDIKLLIAGQDPALSGISMDNVKFATIDGVNYGAMNLEPVKPGDTDMLYTLRLRQG